VLVHGRQLLDRERRRLEVHIRIMTCIKP
jgi:hypothetical protein